MPFSKFFTGPKKPVLAADELLYKIVVPTPSQDSGSAFIKYTRRNAMDLALLGVCVYTALDGDLARCTYSSIYSRLHLFVLIRRKQCYVVKIKDISMNEMGRQVAAEANPLVRVKCQP